MNIEANLPCLVFAPDYHYFREYDEVVKKINPRLKCKEIGFSIGVGYVAVVYFGKMPSKTELKKLLMKVKLED
jgi:hypothetical protein